MTRNATDSASTSRIPAHDTHPSDVLFVSASHASLVLASPVVVSPVAGVGVEEDVAEFVGEGLGGLGGIDPRIRRAPGCHGTSHPP